MMSAGLYLEQLQQDFEAQGLGTTSWQNLPEQPQWTASGWKSLPAQPHWPLLRDILNLTQFAGHEKHRAAASKNPDVVTELGKLMLAYGQSAESVPFCGGNGYVCCSGAEQLLLHTTSPASVANGTHVSPVVVVKNDAPISIIKGYQERTSYGLTTDLPARIMAGAFSQPSANILERMRKSDKPFYLDIKEHGAASQLLRLGGFLVPVSVRTQLLADRPKGISAAPTEIHEHLVQRAHDLLADAVPLPPADEASRQAWAEDENDRYLLA